MAEPMEEEVEVGEPAERPIFSIRILQLIQTAQAQHGIRHNDYDRYRQYCARRLRRLHVKTKFLHGRTRYVKKKMEADMASEERHLHIPLINAERAWAYSMALKNANAEKPSGRTRSHAATRLAKAACWAREVARLAVETCDAATVVEAEAYAAWMHGTWLAEREKEWDVALGKYHRARKLLEELGRSGDFAQQKAARQVLEQIEPAVRFARYQMERQGEKEPAPDALARLGDKEAASSMSDLQSRLADMASSVGPEVHGSAPVSSSSVSWRGRTYRVASDKVASALIKVGEAQDALTRCMDTDSADEAIKAHDVLLHAYRGALRAVHQEMMLGGGGGQDAGGAAGGEGEEGGSASLEELSVAVRGLLGGAALSRYQAEADDLRRRWERQQQRAVMGGKAKGGKEKPARAEDLARTYDTLAGIASELSDLAGEVGGRDAEALMDEGAAQAARFEAQRCFYVAAAALGGGRAEDARALFARAGKLADEAAAKNKACAGSDPATASELAALRDRAAAFRCAAAAECHAAQAAGEEGVTGAVGGLALHDKAPGAGAAGGGAEGGEQRQADKYLLANLDRWESYAGEGGREPRLYQVPPPLESLPARPFVLDTAQNYVTTPALGHRYQARPRTVEKSGTFARLFGWSAGGAKQ